MEDVKGCLFHEVCILYVFFSKRMIWVKVKNVSVGHAICVQVFRQCLHGAEIRGDNGMICLSLPLLDEWLPGPHCCCTSLSPPLLFRISNQHGSEPGEPPATERGHQPTKGCWCRQPVVSINILDRQIMKHVLDQKSSECFLGLIL